MKKILAAAFLLVAGLLVYSYATTGELSLTAAFATSEEQEQVRQLESDLRASIKRYRSAGRGAGLAGIDTTAEVEAARSSARQVKKELDALRKRLTEDGAKRRAEQVAKQLQAFLAELR